MRVEYSEVNVRVLNDDGTVRMSVSSPAHTVVYPSPELLPPNPVGAYPELEKSTDENPR